MLVGQTIGTPEKGEFRIERELGSGAMGTVYRATLTLPDGKKLPVALKVVSLGLLGNEGAMARFDRESAILKQLRHPHIVRLYATGKYRGTPYIAMEFVDGEPLDRALARRGRLGWEEVLGYVKQLCEALHHAHERGIIHRDLKPSNLMITPDGTLKLADFGIAKDADVTALTGANSTIGTAAYMSPEQCRGSRELTAKSDLYSLGVVMYELITGKKPFYADNSMEMFLKHVNDTPVRPSKLVPDLPVWVDNLIMHLLEKAIDTRPLDAATVGRMVADIEQKVQSHKSAGLEVATARRIDRKLNESADVTDADREAARALRGKKKKKKKREEEAVPLLQRTWVKAVGLGVVLLAVVGVGVWLSWPLSPEEAFARASEATGDDRLPELRKFLTSYGSKPHPKVDEARAKFKELRTAEAERQLKNRYGTEGKKFDRRKAQDAETQEVMDQIWAAMTAEKEGQRKEAVASWTYVRENVPDADPAQYSSEDATRLPAYRWVAEKRLADLDAAGKEYQRLDEMIARAADQETPVTDDTGMEARSVRGVRLERFKDAGKANHVWAALATDTAADADKHRRFLFAAERKRLTAPEKGKEDEAAKARPQLVTQTITAARTTWAMVKDDPKELVRWRQVRNACRDLIDLYSDESDETIQAAVAEAKTLLGEAAAK